MPPDFIWIWTLIPLAALTIKGLKEWFKFKTAQRQLGASTSDLEREVAVLKKEREEILDRLQNLETIVVSQTWDAVHDKVLPPPERDLRIASVAHRETTAHDAEAVNRQRAEQLARRLQG